MTRTNVESIEALAAIWTREWRQTLVIFDTIFAEKVAYLYQRCRVSILT